MRAKKPLFIAGAVVAAGLGGLVGTHAANAASDPSTQKNLAGTIANSLHVNRSDVQKAITKYHAQREVQREASNQTKVNQAVKNGKLSQDLADQLISKRKEIDNYRDSLKGKTAKERHDLMKVQIDTFVSWAKANKVPGELLHPFARGRIWGG
jgi:hypothetical protein